MENNLIENEYNLKICMSQRDNQIIIQENKHIFYYSHKRKDNSRVYKCSINKESIKCFAYIILNSDNTFNQIEYNLSHSNHNEKQNEIQTILENNTIKDIINNSFNKFKIKPNIVINEVNSRLGSIKPKYNNVRQNLYNQIKKIIPKDPININNIDRSDAKFIDKFGENILIYKDLNILVFTNKKLMRIAFENKNDLFLDSIFKAVNKLFE